MPIVAAILIASGALGQPNADGSPLQRQLAAWTFTEETDWTGWSPNHAIHNASFETDHVRFDSTGSDPQILSPMFDLSGASNNQWVEIDLDCSGTGWGELFFTNTTQGRYGGLRPRWMSRIRVASAGRQTLRVWPFWEGLDKIIRLRFDPPSGLRCRLHSIRIIETTEVPAESKWAFHELPGSWRPMYAAGFSHKPGFICEVEALEPQAMIITPVRPFDAARRSVLRLDVECPGENLLGLYWVSTEEPGLYGQPVPMSDGRREADQPIDLRQFPEWRGTITHLAIGFGTHGGEKLTLRSIAIEENDPQKPFVRVNYFGLAAPQIDASGKRTLRIDFEHAGGPPLPAGPAELVLHGADCDEPHVERPSLALGERCVIERVIRPGPGGRAAAVLHVGDQEFVDALRFGTASGTVASEVRTVPEPKSVKTDYKIGVYYFPGWSPAEFSRWKHQAEYPERDSLLGWYEEGSPEVADWHIKWAVENGISFFIYDWYWRDGQEAHDAGLNEGFLKARHRDKVEFALMWANHRPYSDHTPQQLVEVTDYWIENYFGQPNYLEFDGIPYVSFFAPGELLTSLGSPQAIREAFDAMRTRVKAAGLPGLHVAACTGSDPNQLDWLQEAGFDSATAYNYVRTGATTAQSPYRQFMLAHEPIWREMHAAGMLPYIPLLTVGWDSRPWHGPRAEARFARSSDAFRAGLERLKAFLDETGGRMAILEAWNEWGEGSYIEPNVEFGFSDLESIREVFAEPGDWPQNYGPSAIGQGGRYDLRQKPAATRAALKHGKLVVPAGVNPAVVEGLEVRCWEDWIAITPGQYRVNDKVRTCEGGSVQVPPAETTRIERLALQVNDGKVRNWRGGNRLVIRPDNRRNVTPDSYVPGSLVLYDPEQPHRYYVSGKDITINDQWGAFELAESGSLKPGQKVVARYRISLRRIDALVIDQAGEVTLIPGRPSPDCPEPPAIPAGAVHLANVYRPFHARIVQPEHVYVPTGEEIDLSPLPGGPTLQPVLTRLRQGESVTVVCWGDSVTVGGDASTPERSYVGRFEQMLKERFGNAEVHVINAGIGGSNTRVRLPDFDEEVLVHEPDLVTLEFVNDMGMPLSEMEQRYTEILQRTREAGAALILITPHFTRPDWMHLDHGRGSDSREAVAFLRRFSKTHGVPLADASRRWEQLQHLGIPYETLLKNGINHPDDRGHRIFAEELMRFFPAH